VTATLDTRLLSALREAGIPHRENEPLSRHTTMGVGGPAAVMAFPRSAVELQSALRLRGELGVPHRVLGGGSNLIVADEGLEELVVNTEEVRKLDIREDGTVVAEAGANLINTVVKCGRAGWRGLESAVGIPGSVGGAAVMNAGAYGFSISDVMREIVVYDEAGEPTTPPEGWKFRYRGSSIPEGAAVASITVKLDRDDPEALREETRALTQKRVSSQPVGRNAGCVFKNPAGTAAGRLIDEVGLKGTRRGGAVVSPRHANFVVNDGGASAADVLALLDLVRERVLAATGVELELEVKVWRPRA
jgi:UDP-N-acetylmuramate dehydrogenase